MPPFERWSFGEVRYMQFLQDQVLLSYLLSLILLDISERFTKCCMISLLIVPKLLICILQLVLVAMGFSCYFKLIWIWSSALLYTVTVINVVRLSLWHSLQCTAHWRMSLQLWRIQLATNLIQSSPILMETLVLGLPGPSQYSALVSVLTAMRLAYLV